MADLLTMPEVATGSAEAVLASWNVEVDAPYSAGDAIVTVETEKAVVDVEAESDGVILHLLTPEGATVEVGTPIAVRGTPGEKVEDIASLLASLGVGGSAAAAEAAPGADEPEAAASPAADAARTARLPDAEVTAADRRTDSAPPRLFASPLARRLAKEAGLDLALVRGTGPRGRVRRADVEAAVRDREDHAPAPTPAPEPAIPPTASTPANRAAGAAAAGYTDVPNSRMRQAIARRLTESKQSAPHFYLRGSARVDRLLALRRELNEAGPLGPSVKVSVNDLLVKAVATAHTLVPGLNVAWNGESTRHFEAVDIALAVATEHGLVTPVLRGVDAMTVTEVARTTQDLAARARDRRLQQAELEGGAISVTNLGMYGTEEFAAIINPPQASILAVGAARQEPVVVEGELSVSTVLRVTLAVDHRPVDGVTAAEWMRAFLALLESPARILA